LQVFLASTGAVSVETAVVAICSEAMKVASLTFQTRVGRNAWNTWVMGHQPSLTHQPTLGTCTLFTALL